MARLGIVEPSDTAAVSVTVRHRCPAFVFGSALGPRNLVTYWWGSPTADLACTGADGATEAEVALISAAICFQLEGLTDYRRHLDELQELPEG